jgi:hypothetical protein
MPASAHFSMRHTERAATWVFAIFALLAGSASAQTARASSDDEPTVQLTAGTAGQGTLEISPGQDGADAVCRVDGQQVAEGQCEHNYPIGTVVTLTAHPDGGNFVGWSDFECRNTSSTCRVKMTGERFITARFSPVVLSIQGTEFGRITVTPAPGGFCELMGDAPPCSFTYRAGTVVSLRRAHTAMEDSAGNGPYWIGACQGNADGKLDADVCRLRVQAHELVGAGYDNAARIPPSRGSSLQVVVVGKGRGKVTGKVVNKGLTLSCGSRCKISGVSLYDAVRLTATKFRGSRFLGWSDGSKLSQRIVQLTSVTKIKATFGRSRRR